MWAKAAAVGNACRAAARCPRSQPVRRRRIVHMSIALPGAKRPAPVGREVLRTAVSDFDRRCGGLAQTAQDHFRDAHCAKL